MSGLFAGTPLERPITCEVCERPMSECTCPRDAAGNVRRPGDQTARIRLEKRRRGKVVTLIDGLDPVASDLESILKQLKGRCGAGGTIAADAIEVQGDHRDAIAGELRSLGYQVTIR